MMNADCRDPARADFFTSDGFTISTIDPRNRVPVRGNQEMVWVDRRKGGGKGSVFVQRVRNGFPSIQISDIEGCGFWVTGSAVDDREL